MQAEGPGLRNAESKPVAKTAGLALRINLGQIEGSLSGLLDKFRAPRVVEGRLMALGVMGARGFRDVGGVASRAPDCDLGRLFPVGL